ncbi:MAG: sulfotransferase [Thiocapsa sp.]|nr:MAG: sulfotransferase [Thiocapsa sp.]
MQIETPVAIGGVGGSGTRLIAEMLMRLGFFLGSDLNESLDNLWFTLAFKRLEILRCPDSEFQTCVDLFVRRMQGCTDFAVDDQAFLKQLARADRLQHDSPWLEERVASFCSPAATPAPGGGKWGWKEPNTQVIAERLMRSMTGLKYIHVVRNGLDMAYSQNQNQLRLWGPWVLGMDRIATDPRHALKYWCRVHEHLIGVFDRFPGRCLWVDFDTLCMDPHPTLEGMFDFLDVNPSPRRIDELALLIRPPHSIGRYRGFDSSRLDPQDIASVAKLGFPTENDTSTSDVADVQKKESRTAPGPQRTALVVLGMHRSGTSAFTRVAGLLGGAVPRDLMQPVADNNEAGFWESMGIYRLNDTLLRCAGSRWDDWRDLPFDWDNHQVSDAFMRRATAAVHHAFGSKDLIVIKDPRICRIFPFWHDALQEMGMDVLCLLPVRNPMEVAASLRRRDGFDPAKSYLLWLRHTLDAEAATRGLRRSIVTFDHLMSDWRDCAMRIQQHLGMTWPRAFVMDAAGDIDRFLQERLRHNRASAQDLDNDTSAPQWVKQTFSSFLKLVDQPDSSDALSTLDHVREELRQADRAIGPVFQLEAIAGKRLTRTVGTITASLARHKVLVQELECILSRYRSETNELRSEILVLENRVAALEAKLARCRCRANCNSPPSATAGAFRQEEGSPQLLRSASDNQDASDVLQYCFDNQ